MRERRREKVTVRVRLREMNTWWMPAGERENDAGGTLRTGRRRLDVPRPLMVFFGSGGGLEVERKRVTEEGEDPRSPGPLRFWQVLVVGL